MGTVGSLSIRDRSRLAELEQELADLRRAPRSESITRRINELLDADFTASWGFDRDQDRNSLVEVVRSSSFVPATYFDALSAGLRSGRMGFLFSLRVPQAEQRNRPKMFCGGDVRSRLPWFKKLMGLDRDDPLAAGYLATADLMERHGVIDHTQLRTVFCDGSLVVGYLNTIQPRAFSARQRRLYARASDAVCNRLVFDRRLANSTTINASLEVALGALGRAAFVVDSAGRIIHANALGELALDNDNTLRGTLVATAGGISTAFDVLPISVAGSPCAYLVVKKTAELAELTIAIAVELALGDRTRAVFMLAAAGEPTKAIATRLDLAENTVEYHLGVIFRRLGIASRSELYQVLLERALAGRG